MIVPTPLGEMLALSSDEGLCALEFTGPNAPARGLKRRLRRWFPPHEIVDGETPTIARTRAWLAAYFDGTAARRSTTAARHARRAVREARVGGADGDPARPDHQLRRDRAGARVRGRVARGRRGQRREPDRDHRAVPSRHRVDADR